MFVLIMVSKNTESLNYVDNNGACDHNNAFGKHTLKCQTTIGPWHYMCSGTLLKHIHTEDLLCSKTNVLDLTFLDLLPFL